MKGLWSSSFVYFSCLDPQEKSLRSGRLIQSQSNSTLLEDTRNIDLPPDNNIITDDSNLEDQSYNNFDDDNSLLQPKCEVSPRERRDNPSTFVNSNMDSGDISSNPNSSFEDDLPLLDLCNKQRAERESNLSLNQSQDILPLLDPCNNDLSARERIHYSRSLQQPDNSQDLSEITSNSFPRPAINNNLFVNQSQDFQNLVSSTPVHRSNSGRNANNRSSLNQSQDNFEDDLPLLDPCNNELSARERIQYSRPLQQPVNSEITSTSIPRPAINNNLSVNQSQDFQNLVSSTPVPRSNSGRNANNRSSFNQRALEVKLNIFYL